MNMLPLAFDPWTGVGWIVFAVQMLVILAALVVFGCFGLIWFDCWRRNRRERLKPHE